MSLALASRRAAISPAWVKNPLWRTARAVPSLDLQFADNKSLADAVTGQSLVTFTRASSGTYVGSDGVLRTAANDVPRFDHNPTTGESLGLLVEEQRTNLLFQSEDFGTTWVPFGLLAFGSGSTLNAASAPDGQTTADLIVENTANAQHNISQAITTTGAKCFSVFAKQGSGTRLLRMVDFNPTDGGLGETYFNLSTGTVVSGTGSIQAFPNGWYRCSIQSTTTVTSTYYLSLAPNNTTFTYTGDGTSGIYLWGAQLEAGSFPTSYIPTTTAAATRSADVASITGTAFSSWYRQDEGTVFTETQFPAGTAVNSSSRSVIDATDGSTNNRVNVRPIGGGVTADQLTIRSGGSTTAQFSSNGTAVSTSSRRLAAVYKVDDFASWATGATSVATDTSGTLPIGVNQMTIGGTVGATEYLSGTIRRLVFFPQRLPNSTLQALTQ